MAFLRVTHTDDSEQIVPLSKREPVSIGQHASNTISLDDPGVPVLFGRILWNKRTKGYEVAAASLDDIVIAGKSIRSAILKDADEFMVASVRIVFHDQDLPNQPQDSDQEEEPTPEDDSKSSRSSRKNKKKKSDQSAEKQEADSNQEPQEETGVKLVQPAQNVEDASVGDWIKRARRPGERDAVRSPIVTALIFVALLLAVAAGGFYLMIGRQSAQRAYNEAKADREEGKYAQAIQRYGQFLSDFPTSSLANQAQIELSLSRIDRSLSGAGSDLNQALQAIENFVAEHRQREDFRDWFSLLSVYSSRVSIEAYRQAGRLYDPNFLKTGDQAQQLFSRFKATDGSDDLNEQEIENASMQARAELLEFDVQNQTITKMDEALKQKNVSLVLQSYREGVVRYPQFAKKQDFISRIIKTLQFEKKSVKSKLFSEDEKSNSAAVTRKPSATIIKQNVLLVDRRSTRFDIQSDKHLVWFFVDGTFYAVDRMLGELRWKKEAGTPLPFEPLTVNAKYESWLISTRNGTALSLLKQEDGTVLWETNLQASVSSKPVLIDSMLYVLTGNRQLTAVELETGQQVGQIHFPRNISAPICSLGGHELLCVGDEDVFYFVDRQTWKCTEVKYYGHAKGTITVQPQLIADQLLILHRDQLRTSRMQTLRFQKDDWKMQAVQAERLLGAVTGPPVIWGDRLFLKTDRSLISAWHLTNTPGKPLLNRITNAPIPFSPDTNIYMQPFEGDRLLIAGESLREMTLLTNAFEQRGLSVELGRATQSLQIYGTNLSIAGESIPEQGRVLIHYDFEQAESFWRLRLSANPKILINPPGKEKSVRCLDAFGNLFDLARAKSISNINYVEPTERILDLPALPASQIKTGQVLGQKDHLVIQENEVRLLNSSGQTKRSIQLPKKAQIAAASPQAVYWANKSGIHRTAWDSNDSPVSGWLSPIKKNVTKSHHWTDLIAVDDQAVLALSNRETLIALQIREDPRRHLGQSGMLQLKPKAIGAGTFDGQLYWLALENGSIIAIDPHSLVIRQQEKIDALPSAGPWRVDSSVYIELDSSHLSARDAKQIKTEKWSFPLDKSPLATAPFLLTENRLFLCQLNGRYLVLDAGSGKKITEGTLPAPPSCQPILVEQTLYLGLNSGSVISMPLDKLLSKTE